MNDDETNTEKLARLEAEVLSLKTQLATAHDALRWCREMDERFSEGGLILAFNADGVDVVGDALKKTKTEGGG